MTNTVKFLDLAQNELADTFYFEDHKQKGLGKLFLEEVQYTLELIKTYPNIWTHGTPNIQRCLLKGFHYSIMYQMLDNVVLVLAIENMYKVSKYRVPMVLSEKRMSKSKQIPIGLYIR